MRTGKWFGVAILGVGLIAGLIASRWSAARPPQDSVEAQEACLSEEEDSPRVSVTPTKLEMIPAGTVIGDKAPEGWTNLIYISTPVLSEQDLKQAPRMASFYAQLLRYVLLTKVDKKDSAFILEKVAAGFAVDLKGKQTIINSKKTFNADLGAFGNRLLSESEKAFERDVQQVAATPTMRLIDDRQFVRHGKDHVKMIIRHSIFVDPKTGRVNTLVWLMEEKGDQTILAEKEIQLLPEGLHEKYRVSVKPAAFGLLGIPDEDAFARMQIPQGKGIPFTPALRKPAGLKEFTQEQVTELEKALRDAIQGEGK